MPSLILTEHPNEKNPSLLTPGSCTALVCGGFSAALGREPCLWQNREPVSRGVG